MPGKAAGSCKKGSCGVLEACCMARAELDRRIGTTRAGNPWPATGVPTPELEVLLGEHSLSEHVARAGSQQVLGKHLLGKGDRVLPGAGLESRI